MGTKRSIVLLLALSLAGAALAEDGPAPAGNARNVVLVTLDGVRSQEVFGGLDEIIAAHDAQQVYSEIETARERYGGATPEARREALLPCLWQTLAPQGMVFGNAAHGNRVRVENGVLWSTPGYTEMLRGQPRPEVVDNEGRRHPWPTALEVARERLGLDFGQVAQIGSWEGFKLAAASRDDAFLMVGVYDTVPPPWGSEEIDRLAGLRREVMGLWEEGSNDALTFRMARAYLQLRQPRVLWLALVNSDDWAHADRYDRYLEYLHRADGWLCQLWGDLQAMPAYRDNTTLVVTTDHGRGLQGADWAEHEQTIPGSDAIWVAVAGPDTADVGEVTAPGSYTQGQVAATLLWYLGLDASGLGDGARPPLPAAPPQP